MTKNLTSLIKANNKYSKEFDKGDLSHLLMTIGIALFYLGIKKIDVNSAPFIAESSR